MSQTFTNPARLLPVASAAVLAALAGCAVDTSEPRPEDITGSFISVICDADMQATSIVNGVIAPKASNAKDSLTIIKLPIETEPADNTGRWNTGFAQIGVSNSVMGPPCALAVSPDGSMAFVIEHRGPVSADGKTTNVRDLPKGSTVSAINLADPVSPQHAGIMEVGTEPTSVDVRPDGRFLAVTTRRPGRQLAVVPIEDGKMSPAMVFPLLGLKEDDLATCVAWHPSGRYVAVTLPDRNEVAFFEFTENVPMSDGSQGPMGFAPWGSPVKVGKYPYSGKFTPDGRHFITTDLHWGGGVPGFLGTAPEGTLTVVRLSETPSSIADGGTAAEVVHEVAGATTVGISPEGLAIHPDGTYVATANLKRSMLGESDPRLTKGGSISLLAFDASSGTLTPRGEYNITAMPEGITFDRSGKHLAVTMFRSFNPDAVDGELAFFKLVPGADAYLIPAKFYIGVGVGPHGVVIVR